VLMMNHYIACGWVYMGKHGQNSWLTDRHHPNDVALYLTALHWSLTQFTPAAMDVVARNTGESVYSICTICFAFLTFSSVVSSVTTIMHKMRDMQSERDIQEQALRRYFIENNISADLGARISRFLLDTQFSHRLRTFERDMKSLEFLPSFLKNELREELHMPCALQMPFFRSMRSIDLETLRRVCHSSLHQVSYISEEHVFEMETSSEKVFFVVGGFADYIHKRDVTHSQAHRRVSKMSQTVRAPDWVGDPVLWLRWRHQGTLIAKTLLDLTVMSVVDAHHQLSNVRPSFNYGKSYAKLLQIYMRKSHDEWNTDLWCNSTILEDLARIAEAPFSF